MKVKLDFTQTVSTSDIYCSVLQSISEVFSSGSLATSIDAVSRANFEEYSRGGGALCNLTSTEETSSVQAPLDSDNTNGGAGVLNVAATTVIAVGGAAVALAAVVVGRRMYQSRRNRGIIAFATEEEDDSLRRVPSSAAPVEKTPTREIDVSGMSWASGIEDISMSDIGTIGPEITPRSAAHYPV